MRNIKKIVEIHTKEEMGRTKPRIAWIFFFEK